MMHHIMKKQFKKFIIPIYSVMKNNETKYKTPIKIPLNITPPSNTIAHLVLFTLSGLSHVVTPPKKNILFIESLPMLMSVSPQPI